MTDVSKALAGGDLSPLNPEQLTQVYEQACKTLGLDPLTQPIGFFTDDKGQKILVIRKAGAQQLRRNKGLSISKIETTRHGNAIIFIVTGKDENTGRTEVSTGAADLEGLRGSMLTRAILAAETKAKTRVTIDLVGMGLPEEIEQSEQAKEPLVPDVPAVSHEPAQEQTTGLIPPQPPADPELVKILEKVKDAPEPQPRTDLAAEVAKQTHYDDPSPKPTPSGSQSIGSMFEDDAEQPQPSPAQPDSADFPACPTYEHVDSSAPPTPQPVQDIVPGKPDTDARPTSAEFKTFTARCTKLVRDVLPKAGKGAGDLLLPYLRKTFGVKDIQQASKQQWETTLKMLEGAASPSALAALLK